MRADGRPIVVVRFPHGGILAHPLDGDPTPVLTRLALVVGPFATWEVEPGPWPRTVAPVQ